MNIKAELNLRYNETKTQLNEAQQEYGGVYVAQIDEDDAVSYDVEINDGVIAFSIRVDNSDCTGGTTQDDVFIEVKYFLESNGIKVYDFDEWDNALFGEDN
jgi:TPP-dependent 2-oxoacid decarboxylase